MGCQKRKFATWSANLWNQTLPKKQKPECSVAEGSEDKENIPEHAGGLHLGSVHQTQNQHQIKPILECAEGSNALFNLLSSPFTPRSVRETSQAGVGPSPRKGPERTEAMGNQTLVVGNLSNTSSQNIARHIVPAIVSD